MPTLIRVRSLLAGALVLATIVAAPALHAQAGASARPDSQRAVPTGGGMGLRALATLQTLQLANAPELALAVNELLSDTSAHMRMAPSRVATRADSLRAAAIVTTGRAALAQYTDVAAAERDGYVRFLPSLVDQPIYHYNHIGNVLATLSAFDAAKPVSLLYRKDAAGALALVGAMYAAVPGATPDDLDARLPLGIAHWHEHVDFCGPSPEAVRAGTQATDAASLARWLRITSREACATAGGRFVPRLFGWMAHVYLFAGDDPAAIWGGDDHNQMHMHQP